MYSCKKDINTPNQLRIRCAYSPSVETTPTGSPLFQKERPTGDGVIYHPKLPSIEESIGRKEKRRNSLATIVENQLVIGRARLESMTRMMNLYLGVDLVTSRKTRIGYASAHSNPQSYPLIIVGLLPTAWHNIN